MKNYDVIIIGGGASGCMAALTAKNNNIAIIDSGKSLAKKIMVTGNGRCNITNTNMESSYFNQNIDQYLQKFDEKQTLEFFESIGLETYSDSEGRVYPLSNSAKSVVDVIVSKLNNKVESILEQKVIEIKKVDEGFFVTTDKDSYSCQKLVVAAGGNILINVANKWAIDPKPFIPSLTALKCSDVKDLNGVRVSDVKVTVTNSLGESKSEEGEILFKDSGVSGIVVFNLSTMFARSGSYKGSVSVDLLPKLTIDELCKKLENRKSLNVRLTKFFVGMFVNSLANEIFRQSKIDTNIKSSKLTDEQILILAKTIKNLTYKVVGNYDNNQVYSGGVRLSSLDENLMCKQVPNLYFAGEICNVDGVCGGYNLQWAWTSGKIVGDDL